MKKQGACTKQIPPFRKLEGTKGNGGKEIGGGYLQEEKFIGW
jgi:hypothetical protein